MKTERKGRRSRRDVNESMKERAMERNETRAARRRRSVSFFILHPSSFILLLVAGCALGPREIAQNIVMPEQRTIDYRDPAQLPPAPLPETVPPRTVADPRR